jgi:tetratricopeptide (TPR) repeat protein
MNHEEMLEPDLAKKAWLHSVTVNPRFVTTLAFLGLWHIWSGEYAEGVHWADSAIAVDPTYVLGRETAGQLAFELGRIDDAERNFRAYLHLTAGREQVNAYAFLTLIALARGDSAAARRHAEHIESLADPRHPTKHEAAFIGMAMAAIGDTARAIRWISAYQPRGDLHFQLHLKRDPELRWLHGPRGKGLLTLDPK